MSKKVKYVVYQGKKYKLLRDYYDAFKDCTFFVVEGLDYILNDLDDELGFEYGKED